MDFRPTKRLGQNFLIDKNIQDKISASLEITRADTCLEIGAGFGELTECLARLGARVFAVEKDKKIISALKERIALPVNVTLLEGDFLDVEFKRIAGHGKVVVYGNIPYYITSPIIEKLIQNISHIKTIYLVVQAELAERILARAGSRKIGRLSLYVQYYTVPKRLFKIKSDSFFPVPVVDSVFLRLDVRDKKSVSVKNEALFFDVIKKAYSKRRKTVLNALSDQQSDKKSIKSILTASKVNPEARAEELSLEDFARITNEFDNT